MSENSALLDGVRVIDLTRVLAGPYCTQLLGDMGADVIKVEVPGRGDDTRQWGPPWTEDGLSAYFVSANRNKRSMTLNLKSDEGKAILRSLLAEADVLVENFRTGTLEKFGFSYEELQVIRPGLIYATVTGYGYDGPYANRPGYDFMVQAMAALCMAQASQRLKVSPHGRVWPLPTLPLGCLPATPLRPPCIGVRRRAKANALTWRCSIRWWR